MCRDKVDWDEPLPEELRKQWELWLQDLQNSSNVKIKRCYILEKFTDVKKYELHQFSDASVTGYAECSYRRAVSSNGEVHCLLAMAKARVALTKVTTIPHLDLSAAVLAAKDKRIKEFNCHYGTQ